MKAQNIITAVIVAAAGLLASCTQEEVINEDYIVPSVSSYTFNAEGQSFTVSVDASSEEWEVSGWDSWIEAEIDRENNAVTLTASENTTGKIRETSMTFVCGEAEALVSLSQLYSGFEGNFTDIYGYGDKPVFSKNGKYFATYDIEYEGNTSILMPVVVNAETGEAVVYEGSTEYKDIKAVNNDGTLVSVGTSLSCVVLKNGEPVTLEVSGYKNINVEGFSGDGNIMVGYAQEADGRKYAPIKWTDMTPEILSVPDTNINGTALRNGAMARGCSEDGSVIYGSEWDTQGLIYWKDAQMHYVAKESAIVRTVLVSNMFTGELEEDEKTAYIKKQAERYCISPNGKYIGCTFYDYYTDGTTASKSINYPAIVNTEDGTVTLFSEAGFQKSMGMAASDEGVLFGNSTDAGSPAGYVFTIGSESATPVSDWLSSTYGILTDDNRYVLNVSSDGNIVSGWRIEGGATGTSYQGWYCIL